jgi:hypothetical protein
MKRKNKNISKVYEEYIIENVLKRYGIIENEIDLGIDNNKLSKIIEDEFKTEKNKRPFITIS